MHSRRQFIATTVGATVTAGITPGADRPTSGGYPAGSPARFRLGIVTYNIAANWDLPTLLRILRQTKVPIVEFRTGHKHGVEPSLSAEQRKAVRDRCRDAGVTIWGCGTTCEFHSPDKAEVERQIETCKRFAQLVADLGGRGVKVRPNALPRGVPAEKTLEQIGKSLIPCGKAAADAGIEIFVEIHGNGTQRPANMKAIMENCGHPAVGVCWNSNAEDVQNGSVRESFAL